VLVWCNLEILNEALVEVLNNACRELKERRVPEPVVVIKAWCTDSVAWLTIRDNALPNDQQLLSNPFDEDASTYSKHGRGSGLGLAIVRETFRTNGGSCALRANRGPDGSREAGVTFEASLPVYVSTKSREIDDV
jgi:signal transduction histidine kinase